MLFPYISEQSISKLLLLYMARSLKMERLVLAYCSKVYFFSFVQVYQRITYKDLLKILLLLRHHVETCPLYLARCVLYMMHVRAAMSDSFESFRKVKDITPNTVTCVQYSV